MTESTTNSTGTATCGPSSALPMGTKINAEPNPENPRANAATTPAPSASTRGTTDSPANIKFRSPVQAAAPGLQVVQPRGWFERLHPAQVQAAYLVESGYALGQARQR